MVVWGIADLENSEKATENDGESQNVEKGDENTDKRIDENEEENVGREGKVDDVIHTAEPRCLLRDLLFSIGRFPEQNLIVDSSVFPFLTICFHNECMHFV